MRVIHFVKTTDGARWAALQAEQLAKHGVEIHVVLPSMEGQAIDLWHRSNPVFHVMDASLPVKRPDLFIKRSAQIKGLIAEVKPDLIHSHFVTNTMMVRLALGKKHPIPRIFQVPGPLHLENRFFRQAEIATAGESDYWIPSSQYSLNLYRSFGIQPERLFLSYYGFEVDQIGTDERYGLKEEFGLPDDAKLVGNINYMYPPKYYLGQSMGLKRHEDVIRALSIVTKSRQNVYGVLVGGQWGEGTQYEQALRRYGQELAGDRIIFTGAVKGHLARKMWNDFDCAVHVPISENCGGVVEPLVSQVPTIARRTGGLPEVVIDGHTGWIVENGDAEILASKVCEILDDQNEAKIRASLGKKLVFEMFDVARTGKEIFNIYEYLLGHSSCRPISFNASEFMKSGNY